MPFLKASRIDRLERNVLASIPGEASTNGRAPEIKTRPRFSLGSTSRIPHSTLTGVVPKPHRASQYSDSAPYFGTQCGSWVKLFGQGEWDAEKHGRARR